MTSEERFQLIEHQLGEVSARMVKLSEADEESRAAGKRTDARIEKLAALATQTAASIIDHDEQIDKLVKVAQTQQQQWATLTTELQAIRREFQAYLTTVLPKQ